MYPQHLLPKSTYRIIASKHFLETANLVLVRHIESNEVRYMEGTNTLHPDCIKFQSDHLRDLSTNLLGIFQVEDVFYYINREKRGELCALWEEGSEVRAIEPDEFARDEGRSFFYVPISILLGAGPFDIELHRWHFEVFHTPTKCNFWHVSIRVINENGMEASQIPETELKKKAKSRVWKTVRDFMVSSIITTSEISYNKIPDKCYKQ